MTPMRSVAYGMCGLVLVLSGSAGAAKKPKEKYYLEVTGAETAAGVPKDLADKAKAALADLLGKRPEFVTSLAGAPDVKADPEGFRKWLTKKKLRAFKVVVKLTKYSRELAPKGPESKTQVLKVNIALQVLGTGMPDDTMAMTGDGVSQVGLEVGQKVRPKDEQVVNDETLRNALTSALDDAVRKLAMGPPAKPAKR
jgi:hypothetical protein